MSKKASSALKPRLLVRRTFLYASALTRLRLESALFKALLLSTLSCGSLEQDFKQFQKPKQESLDLSLPELKAQCETFRDAKACAKYGYHGKSPEHTRLACDYGDKDSCFNLRQREEKAPSQNMAIIQNQHSLIFGCYVNYSIDTDMGENKREDKIVNMIFDIDPTGNISNLTVEGEKLSEEFKNCVKGGFTAKRFIPTERHQLIKYDFVMPAVKRDRRIPQKGTGLLD